MKKMMVVDDDALMCNQIAALLDWERLGIEIVCYAPGGKEAIEALDRMELHFVLTDMNMPGVSGVDLIEYISKNYPHIHVIALSAYDDFHYVRGSLKYGACDYLLKNRLTKESVESLILEIMKKDQEKQEIQSHISLTVEQLSESFFRRLLKENDFDQEQIGNIVRNLKIPCNKGCLCIMLIYKNQEIEDEMLERSLFHMCQQILREGEFVQMVEMDPAYYCAVISFRKLVSQAEAVSRLEKWGKAIGENGKRFFNVNLAVSISGICQDPRQLHRYYDQAKENGEEFFYDRGQRLICSWRQRGTSAVREKFVDFPDIKKLRMFLKDGDQEGIRRELEDFFVRAKKSKGNISDFREGATRLADKLVSFAEEGISRRFLFDGKEMNYEEFQKIPSFDGWAELFRRILERLFQVMSPVAGHETYHEYTKNALKIIHSRYAESLSQAGLAEEMGISGAYLSKVFKEDVGIGFSDYLNHVRIEHVITAIGNGKGKLKEIAEENGFPNYNYFFKVFKEYTGMTPAQYFNR